MANNTSRQFHCRVCFEVFTAERRYPVVLTCGHTFICIVCAQNLDKCIECQVDLLMPLESVNNAEGRYGSLMKKPKQYSKQRQHFPMPKNIVLLSLMNQSTRVRSANEAESRVVNEDGSSVSGDSGTYTVVSKDGLSVYPFPSHLARAVMPKTQSKATQLKKLTKLTKIWWRNITHPKQPDYRQKLSLPPKDEDQLLYESFKSMTLDNLKGNSDDIIYSARTNAKRKSHSYLTHGDRVQIIDINEKGIARLGLGMGFIHCDNSNIIKVN